jgi:tetratricopeptide (TPR) repeat protein
MPRLPPDPELAPAPDADASPAAALAREINRAGSEEEEHALLLQLATFHEQQGDFDQAADALEDAFALAPSKQALAALARVLPRAGRFVEQAEVLARLASSADGEERTSLLLQRADALEQGGDLDGAMATYDGLLSSGQENPAAVTQLERLLRVPDAQHRAQRLLDGVYRRTGDLPRLGALLDHELRTASGRRRTWLERELAGVREQLGETTSALALYARVAFDAPEEEVPRRKLLALAEASGQRGVAIDALQLLLKKPLPDEVTMELWTGLGQLLLAEPDRAREAVTALEEVLTRAPTNLFALGGLERLYRDLGEHAALLRTLDQRLTVEEHPEARSRLLREVAALAEGPLKNPTLAVRTRERLRASEGTTLENLLGLAALHRAANKPAELAQALEQALPLLPATERGAAVIELFDLRRGSLGDLAGALSGLDGVSLPPAQDAALLGRLFELLEDESLERAHRELAGTRFLQFLGSREPRRRARALEVLGDFAEAPAVKAELLGNAASAWAEDGRDTETGFLAFAKLLRHTPSDARALEEACALAEAGGWNEELRDLLLELRPQVEEPAGRARLCRVLGRLSEGLSEPEAAFESWRGLLEELSGDEEAWAGVERMLARMERDDARVLALAPLVARARRVPAAEPMRVRLALAEEARGNGLAALALLPGPEVELSEELLVALEGLYGRLGRRAEEARLLERLAQGGSPERRCRLWVRRGALCARAGDVDGAAQAYGQALALSPVDTDALAGFEALLAANGLREGLVPPHGALSELARMREELGDGSSALRAYGWAFEVNPEDARVRAELERLALSLGAHAALAQAYEREVSAMGTEPWRAEVGRKLAAIREVELNDLPGAAAALRAVLEKSPGDVRALRALGRVYAALGDAPALARIRREQLRHETSLQQRLSIFRELAALASGPLEDPGTAAECCREVLHHAPEDVESLERLEDALLRLGQPRAAAAELATRLKLVERAGDLEKAAELRDRLAALHLHALHEPDVALALVKDEVAAPARAGARALLEALLESSSPCQEEAVGLLEPLYRAEGNAEGLVKVLVARLRVEAEPQARLKLLHELCQLRAWALKDPKAAFAAAIAALEESPEDERSLALCLQYGEVAQAQETLTGAVEAAAERAREPAARGRLLRALGALHAQAGRWPKVAETWERAFEEGQVDALEALRALERAYSRMRDWAKLQAVFLRQEARIEEPAQRALVLEKRGLLEQGKLAQPEAAIATFRRLLALHPDDAATLLRLDRLLEASEQHGELAEVLRRRIELTAEQGLEQALPLRLRLAKLLDERLGDASGAQALYREILAERPDEGQALAWMEARFSADAKNREAAQALLEAYRRLHESNDLTRILERRLSVAEDREERKRGLVELSSARLASGDLAGAFQALARAVREAPGDKALREELGGLAARAGAWQELFALYEGMLPALSSADAGALSLELGALCEQKRGNGDEAERWYREAGQRHAELQAKALEALDGLWTSQGQWNPLATVLDERAALESDLPTRARLLFRKSALLSERLKDDEGAVAALWASVEADPTTGEALERLEELYEAAGDHQGLFSALERDVALRRGDERQAMLVRMARLCASSLDQPERALELGRTCLRENPAHPEAFECVAELLERLGRSQELSQLLRQRLGRARDTGERTQLHARLGTLLQGPLAQPAQATRHFEAVLESQPGSHAAMEALWALHERLHRPEALAALLDRILEEATFPRLKEARLRAMEVQLDRGDTERGLALGRAALGDGPLSIDALQRLRQAFARAGSPMDEAKALERLLAEAPDDESFAALEALYVSLGQWTPYVQLLARRAHRSEGELRRHCLLKLAEVQESKLASPEDAFHTLLRALKEVPDEEARALWAEAQRLAVLARCGDELSACYAQTVRDSSRPVARALCLEWAAFEADKLGRPASGEAPLRQALAVDPTDFEVLRALGALLARQRKHEEHVAVLRQARELSEDPGLRKTLVLEEAQILTDKLKAPARAVHELQQALDTTPDAELGRKLVGLELSLSLWPEAVETLRGLRDLTPGTVERARLEEELGALEETRLLDFDGAVASYRAALRLDPQSLVALSALERLYEKLQRPEDLLAVLDRQADLTLEAGERVPLLLKAAAVEETSLGRLDDAATRLERVLALNNGQVEALEALARVCEAQGRWSELLSVWERHVPHAGSAREQAQLRLRQGLLCITKLGRVELAEEHLRQTLTLDGRCRPALRALAELKLSQNGYREAADLFRREAELTPEANVSAQRLYEVGRIEEKNLGDPEAALATYTQAFRKDAHALNVLRALRDLHEAAHRWPEYEQALRDEARLVEGPEQAAVYLALARHQHHRREDPQTAALSYARALEAEPTLLAAAHPLSDLLLAMGSFSRAAQALEVVVQCLETQYGQRRERALGHGLAVELCRLGMARERTQDAAGALTAYARANEVDASYLDSLVGQGRLLAQAGRLDEAIKTYERLALADVEGPLSTEAHARLGELQLKQGRKPLARRHLERALLLEPGHAGALRMLARLLESENDITQALSLHRRLWGVLEGEARVAAALELARTVEKHKASPTLAVEALESARQASPTSLAVLKALAVAYRAQRAWVKAVSVFEAIVQHPESAADPLGRKAALLELGQLAARELRDVSKAAAAFEAAWAQLPTDDEAQNALESLLKTSGRVEELEAAYLRMLTRLGEAQSTHAARMALWQKVGALRQEQKRLEPALEAYALAAAGLPEDASVQERFADLALEMPGHEEAALAAYRRVLPTTSRLPHVLTALLALLLRRKDLPGARRVLEAREAFVGGVKGEEAALLEKLRALPPDPGAKARLGKDAWRGWVLHPEVKGPLGSLLGFLAFYAERAVCRDAEVYGIHARRHRVDPEEAHTRAMTVLKEVAHRLGAPLPSLYSPYAVEAADAQRKGHTGPVVDQAGSLQVCLTSPPSLKLGGRFWQPKDSELLRAGTAAALAALRPELRLGCTLSLQELEVLLDASLGLLGYGGRVSDSDAFQRVQKQLKKALKGTLWDEFGRRVHAYLAAGTRDAAQRRADLASYQRASELSVLRAAIVMEGPRVVKRLLVQEEPGGAPSEAKARDLLAFTLSEGLARHLDSPGDQHPTGEKMGAFAA